MAQQVRLIPVFPPDQTLREWADAWLTQHYPSRLNLSRSEVRQAMWQQLPKDYLPTLPSLWAMWWTRVFTDQIAKPLGLIFTDGQAGDRLDAQLALPFVDLEAYCVGKLRLARADVDAVRDLLERYVQHYQLPVNIDQTMQRWQQAAGF